MLYINEIKIGPMGRSTFQLTDSEHARKPLAPATLRKEAYTPWAASLILREYTAGSTMHVGDWSIGNECWRNHPPVADVIGSRGVEGEDLCDPEELELSNDERNAQREAA